MTYITYHHRHRLSPDYISGFSDGEGCFSISFSHKKSMPFGICVTPSFSISQNKESLGVLKRIQDYFQCGFLRVDKHTMKYEVRSLRDLQTRICPHFERYPLHTQKAQDFQIFCEICDLLSHHQAKTSQGLLMIIEKAYTMNACGKNRRIAKHIWIEKCGHSSLTREGE